MAKVKLGLRNLSAAETIIKGNLILYRMQGNPNFPPDTVPPLSVIASSLNELKTATSNAMNHDKVMVSNRNQKQDAFISLLRMLGGWISSQTNDKRKIMSTGFEPIERGGSSKQLTIPQHIRKIFDFKTNILKIIWQPVPGAKQYVVETTPDPYNEKAEWSIAGYTTQSKFIPDRSKMKPLTPYYYRVRPLGTSGIGPVSNIISGAIF